MDLVRNALVESAVQVYREHAPTKDGGCPVPGCAPDAGSAANGECLPYRMADAVLSMWNEPARRQQDGPPVLRAVGPELAALREAASRAGTGAAVTGSGAEGAHPWWCAGAPYCCVPDGLGHVSRPVAVGRATAMLTSVNSVEPMVGIMVPDGEIIVPARDSGELGSVLHELGVLALTSG